MTNPIINRIRGSHQFKLIRGATNDCEPNGFKGEQATMKVPNLLQIHN